MNPIAKMLIDMGKFYQYELEKRQLDLYVEVLSQFPLDEVLRCGKAYARNVANTKFPIPPHKIMSDDAPEPRQLALEASSRVISAVGKHGWCNAAAAREYIGELGWRAVERIGGWVYLCENLGVDLQVTTIQAQVRDLCEATVKLGDAGIFDQPIGLPEQSKPKQHGLTSAGDVIKGLLPEKER